MILGRLAIAVARLIDLVVQIYILLLIIRSLISWVGGMGYNPFFTTLRKLTDPLFRFVHKHIPFTIIGGIDISPILIIISLYFINDLVTGILFDFGRQMLGSGSL